MNCNLSKAAEKVRNSTTREGAPKFTGAVRYKVIGSIEGFDPESPDSPAMRIPVRHALGTEDKQTAQRLVEKIDSAYSPARIPPSGLNLRARFPPPHSNFLRIAFVTRTEKHRRPVVRLQGRLGLYYVKSLSKKWLPRSPGICTVRARRQSPLARKNSTSKSCVASMHFYRSRIRSWTTLSRLRSKDIAPKGGKTFRQWWKHCNRYGGLASHFQVRG